MQDPRMKMLVEKAKSYLQYKVGGRRAWITPVELQSYNYDIEDEGIRIWALQGSPLRGLVIANYALEQVSVLNNLMTRIRIFRVSDL